MTAVAIVTVVLLAAAALSYFFTDVNGTALR
jgi:hypothetical protein